MTIAIGITLCILGVVLGVVLAQRLSPAPRGEQAEESRQHVLDAARSEAEQIKRDAQVESKELLLRAQETAEAELRARREEIEREVQRLGNKRRRRRARPRSWPLARRNRAVGIATYRTASKRRSRRRSEPRTLPIRRRSGWSRSRG